MQNIKIRDAIAIILVTGIIVIISYFFFDRDIALFFDEVVTKDMTIFLDILTTLGRGDLYIVLSLIIFLIYRKKDMFYKKLSLSILWSVIASGVLVNILKVFFARHRPLALFDDNLYGLTWFDGGYIVASFPSGHTTTVFSVFILLILIFPRYKVWFLVVAMITASTRVVLAAHYLSDVIAGGLLGSFVAYFIYKKYYLKDDEVKNDS